MACLLVNDFFGDLWLKSHKKWGFIVCNLYYVSNLHTEKDEKTTCQYISYTWLSLVTKIYRVDSLNMLLHSAGNTADHYTIWRRISELYWVNQKLDGYPIILRKLHSERIFPCGKTVLAQLNETDLTIIPLTKAVLIGLPIMEGIICKDSSSCAQIK